MKREAGDADNRSADLGELDALRDPGLVVTVSQFAAEPGEKKERGNQRGAGERDQDGRIGAGHLEQDDENQRRLEKIVTECRKELAPEQRREAARRHQGQRHVIAFPAVRRPPALLPFAYAIG